MKILMMILICFSLTGCGWFSKQKASIVGHSEHCVDGVEYIQFRNGATVKYLPSGDISTC